MCSEFQVTYRAEDLAEALHRPWKNCTDATTWDRRVHLTTRAPVLLEEGGQLRLREFTFPQRPFPNARLSTLAEIKPPASRAPGPASGLVRIFEKKSWRVGFVERRCLIPMSSFLEPAYWGPEEGSAVAFFPPQEKLFFAAALQLTAIVPRTTEAFSLLTHVASEQMLQYHQRQLVLLKAPDALAWLEGGRADPEEKFEFLLRNRYAPPFRVQRDRRMAPGWKKRKEHHLRDLEAELAYRHALRDQRLAA